MKLPENPKDGEVVEIDGIKFTFVPSRKTNPGGILVGAVPKNTIARAEAICKGLIGIKLSKKEKELLGI